MMMALAIPAATMQIAAAIPTMNSIAIIGATMTMAMASIFSIPMAAGTICIAATGVIGGSSGIIGIAAAATTNPAGAIVAGIIMGADIATIADMIR